MVQYMRPHEQCANRPFWPLVSKYTIFAHVLTKNIINFGGVKAMMHVLYIGTESVKEEIEFSRCQVAEQKEMVKLEGERSRNYFRVFVEEHVSK